MKSFKILIFSMIAVFSLMVAVQFLVSCGTAGKGNETSDPSNESEETTEMMGEETKGRDLLLGNTRAVVSHANAHDISATLLPHDNVLVLTGIIDAVIDQVIQHLQDHRLICVNADMAVIFKLHGIPILRAQLIIALHRSLHLLSQIKRLFF